MLGRMRRPGETLIGSRQNRLDGSSAGKQTSEASQPGSDSLRCAPRFTLPALTTEEPKEDQVCASTDLPLSRIHAYGFALDVPPRLVQRSPIDLCSPHGKRRSGPLATRPRTAEVERAQPAGSARGVVHSPPRMLLTPASPLLSSEETSRGCLVDWGAVWYSPRLLFHSHEIAIRRTGRQAQAESASRSRRSRLHGLPLLVVALADRSCASPESTPGRSPSAQQPSPIRLATTQVRGHSQQTGTACALRCLSL
jgi:hypothetical protein